MKNRANLYSLLTVFLGLFPSGLFSQEKGLDEQINEAFTPIADWWGAVILHNFPGTEIPTIVFLLVGGAGFFTLYFGFVNIRRFPTAINTVRGRYDALDGHNTSSDLAVDGDKKETIKDESEEGEVSRWAGW